MSPALLAAIDRVKRLRAEHDALRPRVEQAIGILHELGEANRQAHMALRDAISDASRLFREEHCGPFPEGDSTAYQEYVR